MPLLRLWKKISRGRRLNIKRVISFPVIVYAAYVFIDSLIPFLLLGLGFAYCIPGQVKVDIKILT